jgi:antitoxin component YwqK of YwqJK toxin-antitoxin module
MNLRFVSAIFLSAYLIAGTSCTGSNKQVEKSTKKNEPKVVKQTRDDGTLSAVSQVDEEGFVHGLKVSYYSDGRTIHSKVSFNHGVKQGPAIWYYKSGNIFEHTNFANGRKEGVTKKYHENGQLLSQCEYLKGDPLPGLVEYAKDGSKITDYPTVSFHKIDKLAFENKVIIEVVSSVKSKNVKYYHLLNMDNGSTIKSYLESKAGVANMEFPVQRGQVLMKKIELFAELPTKLGNTRVEKISYQLAAKNRG